jgi:hypothetical protein
VRRLYGASPLHLLAHLIWIVIAGLALLALLDVRPLTYVLAWLIGAVVLHDFVLLPFYGVLDRLGRIPLRGAINHVRIPVAISGLLLLVYFPVILGRSEPVFARVGGVGFDESYLGRWLLASAALFLGSALLYGVRATRAWVDADSGSRSPGSTS